MEAKEHPEGIEYDEHHVARLNEELKGVEFVDNGDRWRVFKVDFDAEHKEPVCFYFDAKLGDKGTVDDCEYSAVDEVQEWIANHRRRLKAEEAQNMDGPPPRKKSRAERKADPDKTKNDELQKAAKDTKKAHEFLAKMQANHKKDPEGVAAQFKALIDDESTRPAIEAIMQNGMCECAGAHGNLCAWVLMMWMAATRFRLEHGDAAPERLASMNDGAVSAYLVDASVEIKVLRHLRIH